MESLIWRPRTDENEQNIELQSSPVAFFDFPILARFRALLDWPVSWKLRIPENTIIVDKNAKYSRVRGSENCKICNSIRVL